jgi:hypothetical protein
MSGENEETKQPLVIDGETGKPDPHPPIAAEIPLRSALDVRREMAQVYRAMKGKTMDPGDGTKLIYALSAIGKMIEIHEIERRITELEERTNGKSLPAPRAG